MADDRLTVVRHDIGDPVPSLGDVHPRGAGGVPDRQLDPALFALRRLDGECLCTCRGHGENNDADQYRPHGARVALRRGGNGLVTAESGPSPGAGHAARRALDGRRDLVRKRTVVVRKGKSYFARAKR
jgi:hypothetical protein